MPEVEHVVEPGELAFELDEAGLVGDEEEDAAGGAVGGRDAEDGVEVEGATREEAGDVGHRAGVVADAEFDDLRGRGRRRVSKRGDRSVI
jgi:hypothetical protein